MHLIKQGYKIEEIAEILNEEIGQDVFYKMKVSRTIGKISDKVAKTFKKDRRRHIVNKFKNSHM